MHTITPTQSIESPGISQWIPSPLFRLTLEKYEAMVESGVFTRSDKVHLINGLLVAKMTQGDPHPTADELCGVALARAIPPGWHVRADKPVRLPPDSDPEPDRSVVRGAIRDYSHRTPGPADVALVVEVAQSSLSVDRAQGQVYAASGIPVYWIVNLVDGLVEVYSGPSQSGYSSRVDFPAGTDVPVVIDGVQVGVVAVADILP
jgi:Uma2 family endonuclease